MNKMCKIFIMIIFSIIIVDEFDHLFKVSE